MSNITLYEALKGWREDGLFSKYLIVPDGIMLAHDDDLDITMMSNYGNRTIANIVNNCRKYTQDNEPLSSDERRTLSGVIAAHFYEKWQRIAAALEAKYNLLDNVTEDTEVIDTERFIHGKVSTEVTKDLTTTESSSLTHGLVTKEISSNNSTGSGTNIYGKTVNVSDTNSSTEDNTTKYGKSDTKSVDSDTHNSDRSIYAFDSVDASPYEKVVDTSTSTESNVSSGEDILTKTVSGKSASTSTDGGTDSTSKTESVNGETSTTNSGTDSNDRTSTVNGETSTTNSGTDESIKTHNVKRHGNIGVTSSQQMITQEIKMRILFNLAKIITDDVGKFLTLQVYA